MHPERPARLKAVLDALAAPDFAALEWREAPRGAEESILLAHPRGHLDRIKSLVPDQGWRSIDADTAMSPGSYEAALRAVGAGCAAVDAVMTGAARNAFCAVRPPGHHAEPERAMGFCLFNAIAIAAFHARETHGAERVAVIDFDVHHGNGTQAMFWHEPRCLYASTHQAHIFPGTGLADERGVSGNIVNVPLPPMADGTAFRTAMTEHVLPALTAFGADLVLVSAGFDGHRDDPLAALRLVEADFDWATREIRRIADHACQGRIVSMLEGGYDLDSLGRSVSAHVGALMAP